MEIEINNACRLETQIIGNEKTPVITIDEPILSTDQLVQYACEHANFDSDRDFAYPGIRTELPKEYAMTLVPQLIALISHVYGIPRSYRPNVVHQLYSLVSKQPEDLLPLQRMPHTDNRSPYYFASVH